MWPTPLPPPIDLSGVEFNIWSFHDDTVGVWQRAAQDGYTDVLQVALLIGFVLVSIIFIIRQIRSLSNEGESDE